MTKEQAPRGDGEPEERVREWLSHQDESSPEEATRRDIDAIMAKHSPELRVALAPFASPSREAVARIIDPGAMWDLNGVPGFPLVAEPWAGRQQVALAKADAILALALPPAPQGWRDISELPENENLILVWIDEYDAPEVWVATLYFEALRSDAPHMAHLKAQAKTIHWWMYAPKSPYPHPAAPTHPEEAR